MTMRQKALARKCLMISDCKREKLYINFHYTMVKKNVCFLLN